MEAFDFAGRTELPCRPHAARMLERPDVGYQYAH